MKILDKRVLAKLKGRDLVELECHTCKINFYKIASAVRQVKYNPNNKRNKLKFCSISCAQTGKNNIKYKLSKSLGPTSFDINCNWCNKKFSKNRRDFIKSKNHFCSKPCNAKYGNKHRLFGNINRSDFEHWLEENLKKEFSDLDFIFNDRNILNGLELDIYIPYLRLAFEINGISHYQAIYGEKAFAIRKKADRKKRYLSKKKGIRFHSICIKKISKHNRDKYNKYFSVIKNKILSRG